jgi:hypothetical protein
MNIVWLIIAIPLWVAQYVIWIPAVFIWRASVVVFRFALTLGLIGLVLLFVPVIGWIILALILLLRGGDDRDTKALVRELARREGIDGRSIWRPWLIDRVRSEPA